VASLLWFDGYPVVKREMRKRQAHAMHRVGCGTVVTARVKTNGRAM
jgi:hypothetical protein